MGDLFGDRFEVRAELGAGGMGLVYRAWDRALGREVALKTLHDVDADRLFRFKEEFRAIADVHHPNLVRLGELHEAGGQWFFTMEFVDGVDFRSWVRGGHGLSPLVMTRLAKGSTHPPERLDVPRLRAGLLQLAEGLHALHRAGRVHRDVKPSNVLVTPEGRVVLLDFGLTAPIAESGTPGSDLVLAGTIEYMAPEQATGDEAGPRTDWYAFGVLLYECLTGRVPFEGAPLEVLTAKQSRIPMAPSIIDGRVPRDLEQLCLHLLRAQPHRRPGGAEVLRRLAPPGAPPTGSPARRTAFVRVQTSPGSPAPAPFVGRRAELGRLLAALEEVRNGKPRLVLVHGEPGSGKTSLVRELARRVGEVLPGAMLLHGRCHERESLPYKAVDGVVDALARRLRHLSPEELGPLLPERVDLVARMFPVLRRVESIALAPARPAAGEPREQRAQAFAALRKLIAAIAGMSPVALLIDDLQWADEDSLDLLAHLLRAPGTPPVLFVATVRPSPVVERLEELARRGDLPPIERLEVGALELSSARELARLVLARVGRPDIDAETVALEAVGHPGFVLELARAVAEGSDEGLTLEQLLRSRVARLGPPERLVLELCAVAGAPLPLSVVAGAAGMPLGELSELIGGLRDAELVAQSGTREQDLLELNHERLRASALAGLPAAALCERHRRLALAMEAAGSAAERLMHHWREAGEPARAAAYARTAAEQAEAAFEFRRAARLWRAALEQAAAGPERQQLRVRLAGALESAGLGVEAAEELLGASGETPSAQALELRRRAADQLILSGHVARGAGVLRGVLASLRVRFSPGPWRALLSLLWSRLRLRLRGLALARRRGAISATELLRMDACWSAGIGLSTIDPVRGADYQARFLLRALASGDRARAARGLATEAAFLAGAGSRSRERAQRVLERARTLARELDDPYVNGWISLAAAWIGHLSGRFAEGRDHADAALVHFAERCPGATFELRSSRLLTIWTRLFGGELHGFAERTLAGLHDALAQGDRYTASWLRLGAGNIAWLVGDDVARARAEAAEGERDWHGQEVAILPHATMTAETQIALYQGDGAAAQAAIRRLWPTLGRSVGYVQILRVDAWYARGRAAVVAGDSVEALEAAARLERERVAWASALARAIRGGLAARQGQVAEARRRLSEAVSGLEGAGMPAHAAAARVALGRLADSDAGRERAQAAEEWLRAQGVVNPVAFASLLVPSS